MRESGALWVLVALTAVTAAIGLIWISDVQRHQNDAIHSIICFTERYVQHSKKTTPAEKKQVVQFYGRALADAHLAPCNLGGSH